MKCFDCGFNNASQATVCKGCSGPLDRKVVQIHSRPSTDAQLLEIRVFTAEYEAKRYNLMPKQHDETKEVFCERIDRQKTPQVMYEHARLLQAQDAREPKKLPRPSDPQEAARG